MLEVIFMRRVPLPTASLMPDAMAPPFPAVLVRPKKQPRPSTVGADGTGECRRSLLLRPFRPRHYNEIAPIIGLANFEGGTVFQRYQIATLLVAGPASYRAHNEAVSRGPKTRKTSTFRQAVVVVKGESRTDDFMRAIVTLCAATHGALGGAPATRANQECRAA